MGGKTLLSKKIVSHPGSSKLKKVGLTESEKIMVFSYRDYCQYLISSQKNYTLTYLAEHLEGVSHDRINRYLKNQPFPPEAFWKSVEKEIEIDEEGILIYDDTVLNKYSSKEIEIARYQYSGAKKKVLQGIGLVSCIYLNPKTGKYWLIDYRIYNPDEDGKTKLEHLIDMLKAAILEKKLPIKAVLMDSWYASKKVMSVIDNWEKIYYCPLDDYLTAQLCSSTLSFP